MAEQRRIEWILGARDTSGGVFRGAQANIQRLEATYLRLSGVLGALGVGIGFSAIISGFKGMVDAAAKLDDMSEKTGAAVEELSKLEQVARIGGHSLDGVEGVLIRLSKALHGTDEESKGAGKALAALGLSAEELRKKDTAEALRIVAERLNQYRDGAGKTALAIDLLGRSGAQALPFLKDLANEQGISTRVSAEQAAAAEELQKSFARLSNEARNFGQALAHDVVPWLLRLVQATNEANRTKLDLVERFRFGTTLESTADRIRDIGSELDKALQKRNDFLAATGVLPGGAGGDAEIAKLKTRLEFYRTLQREEALALKGGDTRGEQQRFGLAGAVKPALDYASAQRAVASAVKDTNGPFEQLLRQMQDAVARSGELAEVDRAMMQMQTARFQEARLRNPEVAAAIEQQILALARQADAIKATEQADKDATEARRLSDRDKERSIMRYAEVLEEGRRIFESTRTPAEAFALTMENLNRLLSAGAINLDTYGRAAMQAQDELQRLAETEKKVIDEMVEFAKEGARGIETAFSDGLFAVMQGDFKSLGDRFKQMLDRMVADALAAQLGKKLFGDMATTGVPGGWLASLFGLGGGGSTPGTSGGGAAGGLVTDLVGGGGGFAVGTDFVPRTGLALVHRGERIVPAAQNKAVGDGQINANVTIHVYGATDANSFRASSRQVADAVRFGLSRR